MIYYLTIITTEQDNIELGKKRKTLINVLKTHHRFLAHLVQLWDLHEYLCRHIFVQDTVNDGWHRCKKEIEKNQDPIVSH